MERVMMCCSLQLMRMDVMCTLLRAARMQRMRHAMYVFKLVFSSVYPLIGCVNCARRDKHTYTQIDRVSLRLL